MKKILSLTAMVVSVIIAFCGILTLCGAFGNADSYGGSSPYDSGYASFGADYYTYSVNNAAEMVSEANAINNNLRDISDILNAGFGLFMLALGILSFCGFGIIYAGCEAAVQCVCTEACADKQDEEEVYCETEPDFEENTEE